MQGRSCSIPGVKAASTERGWKGQQERQSSEEIGSILVFSELSVMPETKFKR